MALKKLEELGYKPPRKPAARTSEDKREIDTLLSDLEKQGKTNLLNLLVEALSEPDSREILIYGMYVKKRLTPIVPARRSEKIEKTLDWLRKAIDHVEKSWRQ